jgi:hypothetical protein
MDPRIPIDSLQSMGMVSDPPVPMVMPLGTV